MSLKNDLDEKVKEIFKERWTVRKGQVVPAPGDIVLSNDAVRLNGVVLYADMSESTKLVDTKKDRFAAKIYKSFLYCAAKIIRLEGGEITSYDGDRIMAVFIGESKDTSAAKAALKINYARVYIINPALAAQYPNTNYEVKHTVGIDSSELFIALTGIRGYNDLVWVGKSANHAAKMCELPNEYPSRISLKVYNALPDSLKYSNDWRSMWERETWDEMDRIIYRSDWSWKVS